MAQTKKELAETKERIAFLQVYTDFNNWLHNLGFKVGNFTDMSPLNFHYSFYDENINSLHSVEHYFHETLKISLRFLRDRYKHEFLSIDGHGGMSDLIPLEEFKTLIRNEVIRVRDEMLTELNNINIE